MTSSVSVVCDSGPIIHLDEIDCLPLLDDFKTIFVPDQVWQEVTHHRPKALQQSEKRFTKQMVSVATDAKFQSLIRSFSLDYGEQAALTLMKTYPQAIFLTDDAAARLAAMALGFKVHGSIGILLRAIPRGLKTKAEVLTILHTLTNRSTLHIKASFLQEIIEKVENYSN